MSARSRAIKRKAAIDRAENARLLAERKANWHDIVLVSTTLKSRGLLGQHLQTKRYAREGWRLVESIINQGYSDGEIFAWPVNPCTDHAQQVIAKAVRPH